MAQVTCILDRICPSSALSRAVFWRELACCPLVTHYWTMIVTVTLSRHGLKVAVGLGLWAELGEGMFADLKIIYENHELYNKQGNAPVWIARF